MEQKAVVFEYAKSLLNPGGVLFGTTILGQDSDVQHNLLAQTFMSVYNAAHIFNNQRDTSTGLEHALSQHFAQYKVQTIGSTAFFTAT